MNADRLRAIGKGIAIWLPSVVLALFFVMQGLTKLQPASPWTAMFEGWGLPAFFVRVIGLAELLGGLGLLWPRVAGPAALVLAVVMLGACGTHLVHSEWLNVGVTAFLTGAFALIARCRLWQAKARRALSEAPG